MRDDHQYNRERHMASVAAKWEESKFLEWAGRLLGTTEDTSLQTVVPSGEIVERVIDHLAWHNCSIDRGLLPVGRQPTLEEIRGIFYSLSGGD